MDSQSTRQIHPHRWVTFLQWPPWRVKFAVRWSSEDFIVWKCHCRITEDSISMTHLQQCLGASLGAGSLHCTDHYSVINGWNWIWMNKVEIVELIRILLKSSSCVRLLIAPVYFYRRDWWLFWVFTVASQVHVLHILIMLAPGRYCTYTIKSWNICTDGSTLEILMAF